MCDVPSIAAFCSESIENLCGMAFRFLTLFYYSGSPSYCHYDNTFCVPCLLYLCAYFSVAVAAVFVLFLFLWWW